MELQNQLNVGAKILISINCKLSSIGFRSRARFEKDNKTICKWLFLWLSAIHPFVKYE